MMMNASIVASLLLMVTMAMRGVVDAFVMVPRLPRALPRQGSLSRVLHPTSEKPMHRTPLNSVSYDVTIGISNVLLGETSSDNSVFPISLFLVGGMMAAVFIAILPILLATTEKTTTNKILPDSDENQKQETDLIRSPRRRVDGMSSAGTQKAVVGMGRRGTIMTLVGGAASFAASDFLLGAVGNFLTDGSAALSSSAYGAQWNGLFQRIGAMTAKHETAFASPELLAWISRSPAAFANPELRAWVAAQRAFSKSRQLLGMAAVLEEGIVAAGAVAVAAVSSTTRKDDSASTASISCLQAETTKTDASSPSISSEGIQTRTLPNIESPPSVFIDMNDESSDHGH